MKLGVTHQLLVYCSDVNLLGENIHTIIKNAEVLLYANKVDRLDIKVKIICMVCLCNRCCVL